MFDLNNENEIPQKFDGVITDQFLTVAAATQMTGYNNQYLRRLLRNGKLVGVRVGQTWLILFDSLINYMDIIRSISDRRWGSKRPPIPPQ